jgi:predicted nucleotidyltransferase
MNAVIIRMMKKELFLKELKALLVSNFGEDINDVILFGSQVTGRAHEDSDYDVLIILNRDYNWDYQSKITSVIYGMELEYDIFIDTKIISVNELQNTIKGKQPLIVDAIQEGIHA